MATVTTNYGFDIPQSSDLVKDGATAIATLGQDIDTAMNTALGTKKAGMVLLNTTSFSGVSSQSVNDVFSATYDTYRLVTSFFGSTSADSRIKWRISGADNSSNAYYTQNLLASTSSVSTNLNGPVTTGHILGTHVTTNPMVSTYDIGTPFATTKTQIIGMHAKDSEFELKNGVYDAGASFTGFTIIPASGTITGSVSVYGYNK